MSRNFTYKQIKDAIDSTQSCLQAAHQLKCRYVTFRRYAMQFGLFSPNEAGKGLRKPNHSAYKLSDILDGKYPHYGSHKLKIRLIKTELKQAICEECGWSKENKIGVVPIELHHKDGDHFNHKLDNLQILCPNCHALTESYSGRNTRRKS